MREIAWSPKSLRDFKRMVRQNPQLRTLIEETLEQLATDPFHPTLKTHKLSGEFAGIWACSIDYSYRILFEFVANQEEGKEDAILLLNVGDHDDVY
ncbi:type II toxin-antitoxin system mRNA interferase toxin, RelE/StbE family [Nostoc sp. FACHB-87]|uniref:type II toxin-antitoxin system RelE/ParE family toxin n=1 Tax=Nostocaceae TaxID=1162 RepID=UPI00168971A1|nr:MULTISPECIES: type II toxin-antitoxin system mRNA interferase toxin, RelE/StbE family [Nostocaceae]MBD2456938.1 type II toxin-antitoxin system mRNA interferase toxin, RelE/StbE family [Nostoc sp. FACHB-87]MBD2478790.1 type II toxin-antitoxin system mRNA interferase toxin, RelE/StbE family [Anabaena sp. FACHB-83]